METRPQCGPYQAMVPALVSGKLDASQRADVESHLARCDYCRADHGGLLRRRQLALAIANGQSQGDDDVATLEDELLVHLTATSFVNAPAADPVAAVVPAAPAVQVAPAVQPASAPAAEACVETEVAEPGVGVIQPRTVRLPRHADERLGERDRLAPRGLARFWAGFAMGAAFAAAVLLGGWIEMTPAPNTGDDPLRHEIVAGHSRSLMLDHTTDLASSDRHSIKRWFNGKLNYAPQVVDTAGVGYPLMGARLDEVGQRTVAALLYKRREHVINLFVWPTAFTAVDTPSCQIVTLRGFQSVEWLGGGMQFWAVSDLNGGELADFCRLVSARLEWRP